MSQAISSLGRVNPDDDAALAEFAVLQKKMASAILRQKQHEASNHGGKHIHFTQLPTDDEMDGIISTYAGSQEVAKVGSIPTFKSRPIVVGPEGIKESASLWPPPPPGSVNAAEFGNLLDERALVFDFPRSYCQDSFAKPRTFSYGKRSVRSKFSGSRSTDGTCRPGSRESVKGHPKIPRPPPSRQTAADERQENYRKEK